MPGSDQSKAIQFARFWREHRLTCGTFCVQTEDAENDSASDEASEGKSDDKEEESSEEEPAEEEEAEEEEEEDEDDDEPKDPKEDLEEGQFLRPRERRAPLFKFFNPTHGRMP